ncbi:gamma interferon inducible lysosomal thiol reductase [Ostertagia ostertagi]
MHKQLMKAWSLLSQTGRVELVLVPFGKARCTAKGDNDFECSCQHQANECILNQLMNCVIDSVGFPDKIVPGYRLYSRKTQHRERNGVMYSSQLNDGSK